jgi:hypothetical protein
MLYVSYLPSFNLPNRERRGEERKVYKVLLGKPEGKDRWEGQGIDGIRVDLREIGWGGGVLIGFNWQWRAVVNVVMNHQVLAPFS